jgi:F-type H+-transporting ATPase subunit a
LNIALLAGEGFHPPGVQEFYLPAAFDSIPWLVKPIMLVMLSVVIIVVFLHLSSRKQAVVPSRMQYAGELVYGFVRNGIARDTIGSKDYQKFVPLLFAMFTFIMVNNLYGIIPVVYFPPMAKIGFPLVLAVISLVVFNVVGIRKQGFFPYFKNMMFIPGVPVYIYPLLAPIELLTALIIRPFTLTLRLFANMFAGHMLLLVFITGSEYMLLEAANPLLKGAGVFTGALAVGLTFYEIFVELFQAYIFTLLTALYIAGATGDGH